MDAVVADLKKEYKVMVKCPTYNHSRYICDALNGFAIQQTDFPFICVVVDDVSTDGEQDVIKQYANDNCDMSQAELSDDELSSYIKVRHTKNRNCTFLFCLLKKNLYGNPKKQEIFRPWMSICKYVALCEGDDYWTYERKLQNQVEILDANSSVGFVYTGFSTIDENGFPKVFSWYEERMERSYSGDVFKTLIDHNMILTLTICLRMSLYLKYIELSRRYSIGIDYFLFLVIAGFSKSVYIEDRMGCYRINPNSMVQSSRDFVNSLCNRAVVLASKLYLKGQFKKRSCHEDRKIIESIILRLLRLTRAGLCPKKEAFLIVMSSFRMLLLLPVVLGKLLLAKMSFYDKKDFA